MPRGWSFATSGIIGKVWDLSQIPYKMLPRPDVERNSRPTPALELKLCGCVGLGCGVGIHAWLLLVSPLPFSRQSRRDRARTGSAFTVSRAAKKGGLRRPTESQEPRAGAARATRGYVPSFQLAKYSSCSEVRRSILMPSDSSLSLATRLSRSTGTV
jgi:hypothetical protein